MAGSISIKMYAGITINGAVGRNYLIEYQNALRGNSTWQMLTNFELPTIPYLFIDMTSPYASTRFYGVTLK